jgi:flagellar FliL protein
VGVVWSCDAICPAGFAGAGGDLKVSLSFATYPLTMPTADRRTWSAALGVADAGHMANTEDGVPAAAAKSKKKKLIIIGGAAALVLLLGGVGGFVMFGGKGGDHAEAAGAEHGEEGGHGEAKAEAGEKAGGHGAAEASAAFVDLPEMTVNLATADSQKPRYVRLNISLEVDKPEMAAIIKPMMPRVLDSFQTHLRELRPEDIRGSSGAYRLKEELLRRVNTAVAPAKVAAVLFRDIVVQ